MVAAEKRTKEPFPGYATLHEWGNGGVTFREIITSFQQHPEIPLAIQAALYYRAPQDELTSEWLARSTSLKDWQSPDVIEGVKTVFVAVEFPRALNHILASSDPDTNKVLDQSLEELVLLLEEHQYPKRMTDLLSVLTQHIILPAYSQSETVMESKIAQVQKRRGRPPGPKNRIVEAPVDVSVEDSFPEETGEPITTTVLRRDVPIFEVQAPEEGAEASPSPPKFEIRPPPTREIPKLKLPPQKPPPNISFDFRNIAVAGKPPSQPKNGHQGPKGRWKRG